MRRMTSFFAVLVLTVGLVFSPLASAELKDAQAVDPATQARINENYGKIPLAFEINKGQTDSQVDFLSRGAGYSLFLSPTEAVMVLNSRRQETADGRPEKIKDQPSSSSSLPSPASVIKMQLDGGNPSATVFGEEAQSGTSNYFTGNDPDQWRTHVANYGKVRYKGVYEGVDLVYYGNQRKLEYDFIVKPGADYKQIRLNIQGADKVSIDDEGNLVLHMDGGDVVQHKPVVYQTETENITTKAQSHEESILAKGERRENKLPPLIKGDRGGYVSQSGGALAGRYVILANNQTTYNAESSVTLVGFEVDNYDPEKTLVIDPVLAYSTFLGATDYSYGGNRIAVDSSGNAYVSGIVSDTNFPTTVGAYQTTLRGNLLDIFVTKLNATGTALIYSTYLGGGGNDFGRGIAVDSAGNAYITGFVGDGFPTTAGAFQTTNRGGAFVTKLNPAGTALVYSTYLGGTGSSGRGIAVDSAGNAYITGATVSDFPTTAGAYQTTSISCAFSTDCNAFVTKLNPAGTALVYSTYLRGLITELPTSIAVDSSGNAYVTGGASGSFLTTAGAFQTTYGGLNDAFVSKLNATGTALIYSTYLGGSGNDYGNGIAVDSSGNAYISGTTASSNFPMTTDVFQGTFGGRSNAFVTKLNTTGTALVYSTYLGGNDFNYGNGIAVDTSGNAYIIGNTSSTRFPTTAGAYQTTYESAVEYPYLDAFVTKLNPTGTGLIYSTYFGGKSQDTGNGIAVDSSGNAYITGSAYSPDFPTTSGAYRTTTPSGGRYDVFVAKLNLGDIIATTTPTPTTTPGATAFSGTYSGSGLTINLTQSSTTLSGTFSAGSINGNIGGFVDSSGRAYTWAWFDSLLGGSGILAGNLTLSGSQGTFSFGGGQSTGGRIGATLLSNMTKATLSGSTTQTSVSTSTANFAGTYTTTGLTITLTQSGTTLSGTFNSGGLTGTMGGFVDSSGKANVLAYWDSSTSGSGVLAGKLTLSGSLATISFGGGQSSGGTISELVLSNMTKQ